jgi:ATP-binding cassette subfamily F protein uup
MKFLNPTITAAVVLFYLPFLTSSFSNNNNYFLKTALRINTRIHAVVGSSSSNSNGSTSSNAQPLPPAITIDDVTCSHDGGTTYQLQNVNYVLPRGAKIGLVGRNGCGKSTLLKILAESTVDAEIGKGGGSGGKNVINKDEGVVYTGCIEKGKGCRVAYVEQEPAMPSDITVADALLGITTAPGAVGSLVIDGKKNIFSAVRAYRLTAKNAEQDPRAFAEATSNMEVLDGWTVLTKADEVATKLRVKHLENSPLSTLSGGERKRVALASALIQDPDVLLLDEPTNHLDLSAIQWLSDLIKDRPKITLLTVTHDRAFLEDVCDTILELDRGSLYTYQGNYANFLEKKAERLANEDAEIQSAKAKYAVELDWTRRQPQARGKERCV